MEQSDLSQFACVNAQCLWYGKREDNRLAVEATYGKDPLRLLRCRSCGARFSERHGTPLFASKLPRAKFVDVVRHLAEGCGVRRTARLTGVARNTVSRILRVVGAHAQSVHDTLVRDVAVSEAQFDEMWSFVGKKRQASHPRGSGLRGLGQSMGPSGH